MSRPEAGPAKYTIPRDGIRRLAVVARAVGGHVEVVSLREGEIPEALARALELATREPRPPLEPPVEASLVAALVATAVHATAEKGSAS
jgi:hypothetical protein